MERKTKERLIWIIMLGSGFYMFFGVIIIAAIGSFKDIFILFWCISIPITYLAANKVEYYSILNAKPPIHPHHGH